MWRIGRIWVCRRCYRAKSRPQGFQGLSCDSDWLSDPSRRASKGKAAATLRTQSQMRVEDFAGLDRAEWKNIFLNAAAILERGLTVNDHGC